MTRVLRNIECNESGEIIWRKGPKCSAKGFKFYIL
jgi:hypothetical protein